MTANALNETALRKEWLKQHFASYEYQQELLLLHEQWYGRIKQALARAQVERDYPEDYKFFSEIAFKNFDRVATPGQWSRELQQEHPATGPFRAIPDYREIMYPSYWEWMADDEREAIHVLWLRMNQMCTNIRRTVDKTWFQKFFGNDDELLDEESTGPIDWPANWREQVLGGEAAALTDKEAIRIRAGQPVPEAGTYVALDPHDRRFTVVVGDQLPDLESSYGITIWQRVGD